MTKKEKMTIEKKKQMKKRLEKIRGKIKKWKKILHLNTTIFLVPTKFPQEEDDLESTVSTIKADYPYLQAIMEIDLEKLSPDTNLNRIASHELLHIIIGKIYHKIIILADKRITQQEKEEVKYEEERAVDTISKIMCELLKISGEMIITNKKKHKTKRKKKGGEKNEKKS